MGKQEIPWPSHSSPRYGRTGEGNSPGVNIFIRYIYCTISFNSNVTRHRPDCFVENRFMSRVTCTSVG
jgi:hypothetical protein